MFEGCCKDAPPGKYCIRLGLQGKQKASFGGRFVLPIGVFARESREGHPSFFLSPSFFALILRGIDKKSENFFLLYRLPPISR